KPALPKATQNIDPSLIENEEDIVAYLMFPDTAREYFEWRSLPTEDRPPIPADVEEAEAETGETVIRT
ncbi:MAG: pyruvate carboxylase subunit B, partial [Nitrospinae bacterium]|nr:pyruvate carboxylase subunit B [Nitrospinota bacterium]